MKLQVLSMDAADYATAMSQRYNGELYALHVIHADVDLGWPHVTSEDQDLRGYYLEALHHML